jgi:hypothetical protein
MSFCPFQRIISNCKGLSEFRSSGEWFDDVDYMGNHISDAMPTRD